MIGRKFSDIVQDCVKSLRQVSGPSVQVYSEDHLMNLVQQNFEVFFSRHWWPHYTQWITKTLDGSSGVITGTLDDVQDYTDIQGVFPAGTNRKLRSLPTGLNPNTLSGTQPRYIEPYGVGNKRFRVWPLGAVGDVDIRARLRPERFVADDLVMMDDLLLVFKSCMDFTVSDGSNPDEANRFKAAFDERYTTIQSNELEQDIELDGRMSDIPDQWYETHP